ncbi:hypothetical protein BN1708_020361, partial [Verticillium longisporum]
RSQPEQRDCGHPGPLGAQHYWCQANRRDCQECRRLSLPQRRRQS